MEKSTTISNFFRYGRFNPHKSIEAHINWDEMTITPIDNDPEIQKPFHELIKVREEEMKSGGCGRWIIIGNILIWVLVILGLT